MLVFCHDQDVVEEMIHWTAQCGQRPQAGLVISASASQARHGRVQLALGVVLEERRIERGRWHAAQNVFGALERDRETLKILGCLSPHAFERGQPKRALLGIVERVRLARAQHCVDLVSSVAARDKDVAQPVEQERFQIRDDVSGRPLGD